MTESDRHRGVRVFVRAATADQAKRWRDEARARGLTFQAHAAALLDGACREHCLHGIMREGTCVFCGWTKETDR